MISKDKEYTTRSGLETIIYAVYEKEVHGAIIYDDGDMDVFIWHVDGVYSRDIKDCHLDLIEKPKTIKVCIGVYDISIVKGEMLVTSAKFNNESEFVAYLLRSNYKRLDFIEKEYTVK